MGWLLCLFVGCTVEDAPCEAECPDGTRKVVVDQIEITDVTTFSYSADQSCEVWCEPEQTCLAPNVPVIDDEQYTCQPLDGFADIPLPSEVDTSFAEVWVDGGSHVPGAGFVPLLGSVVEGTIASLASVTAVDADGNGNPELYGVSTDGTQGYLLAADGAGGLTVVSTVALPGAANGGAAPGRINSDPYIDWIGWDNDLGSVWILMSNVDGTLAPPIVVSNHQAEDARVFDIDGDLWHDIVLDGEVLLFGDGLGGYTVVEADGAAGAWGGHWGWGDIDANGRVDLANAQAGGSFYHQSSPRSFDATTGMYGTSTPGPVTFADIDGDGFDDHLTVVEGNACVGTCLEALFGASNGVLRAPQSIDWPFVSPGEMARGGCDMTRNLIDDAAILVEDSVVFILGEAGGELTAGVVPYDGVATRIEAVDIDGDGYCEAVVLAPGPKTTTYWVVKP